MTPAQPTSHLDAAAVTANGGNKEQVNVRLTRVAKKILAELSQRMGISQADVLELLLREKKKRGDEPVDFK